MAEPNAVPLIQTEPGGAPPGQQAAFALLADPATYGPGTGPVTRIDTHISAIFLAGDRAYKIKRAVTLPFLDFSTPDRRRDACRTELEINRRTAPELYLGLIEIRRDGNGVLSLDGAGETIDWVVAMRRFDQDRQLDRMAAAGLLTGAHILALAEAIARFHDEAPLRPDHGGQAGIRTVIDSNAACFARHVPAIFTKDQAERVTQNTRDWTSRLDALLESRRISGRVRRCHGDLHLGNICLIGERPLLFDAIEFREDFACIDTFYDLAFLIMDLVARDLPVFANRLLNRYLELVADADGLAALPLFLSLRAGIRAHVLAEIAHKGGPESMQDEAQRYMTLAEEFLSPPPPRLIAIGGLSGSGKTSLARSLAPFIGNPPGALVLRSDVLRKRLMGVPPETRLPPEAYRPDVTEATYENLMAEAETVLAGGTCVILDAVFAKESERTCAHALAVRLGTPFRGLWLESETALRADRVAGRTNDASDATPEVAARQEQYTLGRMDWDRIDSSGPKDATQEAARRILRI